MLPIYHNWIRLIWERYAPDQFVPLCACFLLKGHYVKGLLLVKGVRERVLWEGLFLPLKKDLIGWKGSLLLARGTIK